MSVNIGTQLANLVQFTAELIVCGSGAKWTARGGGGRASSNLQRHQTTIPLRDSKVAREATETSSVKSGGQRARSLEAARSLRIRVRPSVRLSA